MVDHRELRLAHRLPRRLDRVRRARTRDYFNANGRYGDPVHGQHGGSHDQRRLLARLLQPHPRRRRRLLLRRGDGRPAGRPGVGRPRRPARRRSTCGCARPARATRLPAGQRGLAPRAASGSSWSSRSRPASTPNWAQFVPGPGQGRRHPRRRHRPVVRPGHLHTPRHQGRQVLRRERADAAVSRSPTTSARSTSPFYVRLRGSDGNRTAAGLNGAASTRPARPSTSSGDADPWDDLWFYTNPIWVLPA